MEKISDNIVYWIEDFEKVKRLSYGYYNPDDMTDSIEDVMRENQAEYIGKISNLSKYSKIYLYEDDITAGYKSIKCGEIIKEDEYEQELIKPFCCRDKASRSHITITKKASNNPREIAVQFGCLFLVPKEYAVNDFAEHLAKLCKKYKYEAHNTDEYQGMFDEITTMYEGSSIITDLGFYATGFTYRNKPQYVALIRSQNIYGMLSKK